MTVSALAGFGFAPRASAKNIRFNPVNDSCVKGFKFKKNVEFQVCDDGYYKVKLGLKRRIPLKHWNRLVHVMINRKLASIEKAQKKSKKKGAKDKCTIAFYVGKSGAKPHIFAKCGQIYRQGREGDSLNQMTKVDKTTWMNEWTKAFPEVAQN